MIIVLIGPPGAGKSKQSELLKEREHITWLSAGQLLRELKDPSVDEVMNRGELVDDDFVNETVKQHLDRVSRQEVAVLDGFPRHVAQAEWLLNYSRDTGRDIGMIIHLQLNPDISRQRLLGRGEARDNPQSVNERLEDYAATIEPIIEYFAQAGITIKAVNGDQTIEDVFNDMDNLISHVHNRKN